MSFCKLIDPMHRLSFSYVRPKLAFTFADTGMIMCKLKLVFFGAYVAQVG